MEPNQIVIYQTKDGQTAVDVNLSQETMWLTQSQMVSLFKRDQSVISRHINNIFKEEKLVEKAICILCILQILTNQ
ncbi:hypothetical protein [Pedobacter sp. Leaf216]|uniref:hypothetical protein n=1 Tax=Pedobacter sp. Leaf216 TaxID=1735684 RepID=UPI0009EAC768|nr:hypothetical protein [Pedobacter sp. Leaf216]